MYGCLILLHSIFDYFSFNNYYWWLTEQSIPCIAHVCLCICWQVRIEACGDSCGDPTIIVNFCQQGWVVVFIIAAEIYHVLGAVVYLLLGSGEEQWWAKGSGLVENVKTTIRRTSSSFSFQPLKGRIRAFFRELYKTILILLHNICKAYIII